MHRVIGCLFLSILLMNGNRAWLHAQPAQAQSAHIIFVDTLHDFSRIREGDGKVEHIFEFINDGKVPLLLHGVGTSCGCTASDWSKEPVLPGDKGFVKAVYNPLGRPGSFTKQLSVRSNADPSLVNLYIKGYVVPRQMTASQRFLRRFGTLGVETPFVALGQVLHNGKSRSGVTVYNFGSEETTLTVKSDHKALHVTPRKVRLASHDTVRLEVEIDGTKLDDWGMGTVSMSLSNERENMTVKVGYSREEDFGDLDDEEIAQRGRCEVVGDTRYGFGVVTEGEVIKHRFVLRNSGVGTLLLRQLSSPSANVTVTPNPMSLEAGAQVEVEVRFYTRGYVGKQFKQVMVITDDPRYAHVLLELHGQVVEAQ